VSHGDGADPAAARTQISQHLAGRQLHLLAQALRHHRGADKTEQVVGVGAQATAIERRQDAGLMTDLGIVDRRIGEMAVDMERAAAGEIEHRKWVPEIVVATAHDRTLAAFRHDERQRGLRDLSVMDRNRIFRRHVDEHAPEPVVRHRGDQVRGDPELGAAERGRDGVAAERHRIVARHGLVVAGRKRVGQEGNVDIALADKERLHCAYPLFRNPAAMPLMVR
jgi:hypothetical protein